MSTARRLPLGSLRTTLQLPTGWQPSDGVVVLLHGFGAPGDDLVPLANYLGAPKVGWAFPEAPLELHGLYGDARAWWMIDLARFEQQAARGQLLDRVGEVPDGLAPARAAVIGMLAALAAETGVPDERVVLGGFSQGAMVSLDVLLHTERAFAGALLMSGTFIAEPLWAPRMAARAGLPVLMSHGQQDPLLPLAASELLRDRLRAAGLDVEWLPFAGGHAIPPQVLAAAGLLIRSKLG
jgi:phospholipase/carboxylesterase